MLIVKMDRHAHGYIYIVFNGMIGLYRIIAWTPTQYYVVSYPIKYHGFYRTTACI